MSLFSWDGGWPLLLLGPLAWQVQRLFERQHVRRAERVFGARAALLADDRSPRALALRRLLSAAALFCAGLALMGPLGPEVVPEVPGRGVDLVVCLDVSRSMLARDERPDRLQRARAELAALAEHAAGDRLALVTFAGDAQLAVPLTRDLDSWRALLADADPLSARVGGSDVDGALRRALAALPEGGARHGAVLLASDGEHTGADLGEVLAAFDARGLPLHALALGSPRGSRIPEPGVGGVEGFLRDRDGHEVVTRADVAGLRALVDAVGGVCVRPEEEPGALRAFHDAELRARARDVVADASLATRAPRFQWPLLAAVLLGMLGLCLSERKPPA